MQKEKLKKKKKVLQMGQFHQSHYEIMAPPAAPCYLTHSPTSSQSCPAQKFIVFMFPARPKRTYPYPHRQRRKFLFFFFAFLNNFCIFVCFFVSHDLTDAVIVYEAWPSLAQGHKFRASNEDRTH